jgi:hypothetical protein
MTNSSSDSSGIGCLFLVALLGFGVYGIYVLLNNAGWIAHTAEVDVEMDSNWLVGENRDCMSQHTFPSPNDGRLETLYCPVSAKDQEKHNITVKFWGKVVRPFTDKRDITTSIHSWKCTRTDEGFVCRARD